MSDTPFYIALLLIAALASVWVSLMFDLFAMRHLVTHLTDLLEVAFKGDLPEP